MKTIELIISSTGQVRLETRGFAGDSCLKSAEFLRQSLGQVAHETRTPEFYTSATENQSLLSITPPPS
jgi:hypothetical protein